MDPIKVIESQEVEAVISRLTHSQQKSYLAMYSSWLGGITTDPRLMFVPVDDHIVHRGDGIFEAIKAIGRKVFLLEAHLDRLFRSAETLSLQIPVSREDLKNIILQTLQVANAPDCLIRLFVSRGPGGFTTNPYESIAPQIYLVITAFQAVAETKYEAGVHIGRSQIAMKEPVLARTKSCNYLPNVLMKKEALDRKLDFTVSFDAKGFLGESSTENIALIDQNGIFVHPKLDQILKGTTMVRATQLAQSWLKTEVRDLTEKEILNAQEVMMIGTTLDVLPVVSYEGQLIGNGKVGSQSKKLRAMIREDIQKSDFNY